MNAGSEDGAGFGERQGGEGRGELPASNVGTRHDHHRLDVYRVAIEFVRWRNDALRRLPRSSDLADQLTRAATSIVLNIAEACGEFSQADRVRFFRIARRSATECDAILDVATALELDDAQTLERGRALLERILAMLTALVRRRG